MDNNPKYWMVVKGSNKDTTFYTLKKKKQEQNCLINISLKKKLKKS